MARIAFILLTHKDPDAVVAQAERLTAAGDLVALHHDAAAPKAEFARIRTALAGNPAVVLVEARRRCGWGQWSLVDATLRTLRSALAAFPEASHFYLVSGDCLPIRPADHARAFLDAEDADFIENHDFFKTDWIRTGMREERLIYRHPVNERRHKRLFYALLELQRRLGMKRRLPADLRIRIGSQWWCLRRQTVRLILDFCTARPDLIRFFRQTWIPDETFFQSLVPHLVQRERIRSRSLTFMMFSDYGMPVTFHDDHLDFLLQQDALFVRKVSGEADLLRDRLGRLFASGEAALPPATDGRPLYRFLAGRGRIGRRFAPNAWEAAASLGRDREVLIVACANRTLGRRLAGRIRQQTGLPGADYLFDDPGSSGPDLGGLQTSPEKRGRHRRALLGLLFEVWKTDRLIFCIDPANAAVLADLRADRCSTRILQVDCELDHAGLRDPALPGGMPAVTSHRLLAELRRAAQDGDQRLRDSGFAEIHRFRRLTSCDENAVSLAAFLGIPVARAKDIAAPGTLCAD